MPVKLDLVVRDYTHSAHGVSRLMVSRAFHAALPYLHVARGVTATLAVVVVGPVRMRTLNRRWRKVDAPTDVLAFPLSEPATKGYTEQLLGDVFICPAVVGAKARAQGTTERYQMQWTMVHGLLHLAGYDHQKSRAAAATMSRIENSILKTLQKRT